MMILCFFFSDKMAVNYENDSFNAILCQFRSIFDFLIENMKTRRGRSKRKTASYSVLKIPTSRIKLNCSCYRDVER
jgi:hypothetical protein